MVLIWREYTFRYRFIEDCFQNFRHNYCWTKIPTINCWLLQILCQGKRHMQKQMILIKSKIDQISANERFYWRGKYSIPVVETFCEPNISKETRTKFHPKALLSWSEVALFPTNWSLTKIHSKTNHVCFLNVCPSMCSFKNRLNRKIVLSDTRVKTSENSGPNGISASQREKGEKCLIWCCQQKGHHRCLPFLGKMTWFKILANLSGQWTKWKLETGIPKFCRFPGITDGFRKIASIWIHCRGHIWKNSGRENTLPVRAYIWRIFTNKSEPWN